MCSASTCRLWVLFFWADKGWNLWFLSCWWIQGRQKSSYHSNALDCTSAKSHTCCCVMLPTTVSTLYLDEQGWVLEKYSQFIIFMHALFCPMRFRKEISCDALRSCGIYRKVQHYLGLLTPFTVPGSLNLLELLTHLNNWIVFSPQCHQKDEVIAFWCTLGSFRIKSYVLCAKVQATGPA